MFETPRRSARDLGLFFLRAMVGIMMLLGHGWPKLANFSGKMANFPDPLGISSTVSLTLAVGAEFFCSILLILGLATRLAAIPLSITMFVAAFVVHAGDGWSHMEPALLYMVVFLAILFAGPGGWSIDAWLDWSSGVDGEHD